MAAVLAAALWLATRPDARPALAVIPNRPVALADAIAQGATPAPIRLGGRHILAGDPPPAPDRPVLQQWPGFQALARFTGDSAILAFDDPLNRYRISVDTLPGAELVLTRPVGATLITGLGPGPHLLRVARLTESLDGPGRFLGLYLPPGSSPLPPPDPPARRIEFIGDSDTVGYANTADSRDCTGEQVFQATDTDLAFPALVAGALGADDRVHAVSGLGAVRNYGGADPGRTLPALYPHLLADAQSPLAPGDWVPQVIVVTLGSNDFATALQPDERWPDPSALQADFETTLATFLRQLRRGAQDAAILMVAFDEGHDPAYLAAHEAVLRQMQAEEAGPVDLLILPAPDRTACHWHPSLADHRAIADAIATRLDRIGPPWGE